MRDYHSLGIAFHCLIVDIIYAHILLLFSFQSVDNEIVLWEPKTKDQSPGEVRIPPKCYTSDLPVLYI